MSSTISTKQNRAIEALLSGGDHEHAAAVAGVTPRTVSRWKSEPDFEHELQRRANAAVADATRKLKMAVDAAVDVMLAIMHDADVHESIRLRAADRLVGHAVKLMELTDIEQRVTALEERLNDD